VEERLRAAERAYQASGSSQDLARLYAERARVQEPVPAFVAGCWLERELARTGDGILWRGLQAESGDYLLVRVYEVRSDHQRERVRRVLGRRARIAHPTVPALLEHSPHPLTLERDGERVPHLVSLEELLDPVAELFRLSPLSWQEVLGLAIPLCGTLAAIRAAGLVHRAISPRRILVSEGAPFLVGFSQVGLLPGSDELELTRTHGPFGAPYFMAPEQMRADPATTASDVYSLAASLYCALSGRLPFSAPTVGQLSQRIVRDPLPDPREFAPDLPAEVVQLVLLGMHKDPRRRPTPEELAEGCRALLTGAPLAAGLTARSRRTWLQRAWGLFSG